MAKKESDKRVTLPRDNNLPEEVFKHLEAMLNGEAPTTIDSNVMALAPEKRADKLRELYPGIDKITDLSLLGVEPTPKMIKALADGERKVAKS